MKGLLKVEQRTGQNLLELIPERLREFETDEDGLISIIQPKFKNKFFRKYLVPRLKKPFFHVHLDEYGSNVWKLCDGAHSIEQIGQLLHQSYGEQVEPVYERLANFFQHLYRLKFIRYQNYSKPA